MYTSILALVYKISDRYFISTVIQKTAVILAYITAVILGQNLAYITVVILDKNLAHTTTVTLGQNLAHITAVILGQNLAFITAEPYSGSKFGLHNSGYS